MGAPAPALMHRRERAGNLSVGAQAKRPPWPQLLASISSLCPRPQLAVGGAFFGQAGSENPPEILAPVAPPLGKGPLTDLGAGCAPQRSLGVAPPESHNPLAVPQRTIWCWKAPPNASRGLARSFQRPRSLGLL